MRRSLTHPTPLADVTQSTLAQGNLPLSKSCENLSSPARTNNPYGDQVIPSTNAEILRILENRRRADSRRLSPLMATAATVGSWPSTPLSPLASFFEEPAVIPGPYYGQAATPAYTSPEFVPSPNVQTKTAARESSPSPMPLGSAPSSPTTMMTATNSTLTKIYQNGRPVPFRKEEEETFHPNTHPFIRVQFTRGEGLYRIGDEPLKVNQYVIVDGDRGRDMGKVIGAEATATTDSRRRIQCAATEEEVENYRNQLPAEDAAALEFTRMQAARHLGNRITVTQTCFQFDKARLTVYYTSADRVYFVPLLKVLNQQYRCRIWMEREEDLAEAAQQQQQQPPQSQQ